MLGGPDVSFYFCFHLQLRYNQMLLPSGMPCFQNHLRRHFPNVFCYLDAETKKPPPLSTPNLVVRKAEFSPPPLLLAGQRHNPAPL